MFVLLSCNGQIAPIAAVGNGSSGPGTSDGEGEPRPEQEDIYIDIESKGQLGGIPYFVDADCKVSIKPFAPIEGILPAYENRLAFTSIKPSNNSNIRIDRAFEGDVEFRFTLAVKSSTGLTSGFAAGYSQLNFPPAAKYQDPQHHSYLGASWDEQSNGFSLQGWDSDAPVGFPLSIPNAEEIDLRMTRAGGFVVMSARVTPPDPSEEGGWMDVVTVPDPSPSDPCQLEFGTDTLDSGAEYFFDYFYVGGPTVGGVAETPPMETMNDAIEDIDQAKAFVDLETPVFTAASDSIANAIAHVTNAQQQISAAAGKGAFQEGTKTSLAVKAAARTLKALVKAKTGSDSGLIAKKASILKSLCDARGLAVVTIANLAGVKTSSAKKLPVGN
ncbi:MAG: hypothetical protein ACKVS6_15265 [Planctomycetota bacterium]